MDKMDKTGKRGFNDTNLLPAMLGSSHIDPATQRERAH